MELHPDGYVQVTHEGKSRLEHILIAEKAFGRPLPRGVIVHHVDEDRINNAPTNLVICSRAYHGLIHQRMRAFSACGRYDWMPCSRCGKYDDPANMRTYGRQYHHVACDNAYQASYQRLQRAKKAKQ